MLKSFNAKDLLAIEKLKRTNLINSLSGYKSVNLVGTKSMAGSPNLAIFSSVFHVGADPALQGMIVRPDTVIRDTLDNIRNTGKFTLNQVHQGIQDQAHQTAARYPQDVSEFAITGLSEETINGFHAPFVKESLVKSALELVEIIELPINGTHLILGKVIAVHLDESLVTESGRIDLITAKTLGVIGLDTYVCPETSQTLPYAKP